MDDRAGLVAEHPHGLRRRRRRTYSWSELSPPPPTSALVAAENLIVDVHKAMHNRRSSEEVSSLRDRARILATELDSDGSNPSLAEQVEVEELDSVRVLRSTLRRMSSMLQPGSSKPVLERQLAPVYEELAGQLRHHGRQKVPMLRRFKRLRTAYHVTSGLTIVGMVKYTQFHFEGEGYAFRFWLALVACGMSWCAEFLKHRVPWFKRIMKRTLGPIAHESEFHTVNSATWFMTGLVVLGCRGLTGIDANASALGVTALAVGDPAAAFVGSTCGRVRLYGKKTLEGTLAFATCTFVCCVALLRATAPDDGVPLEGTIAQALTAAVVGAVVELYALAFPGLDDNFLVPVCTALSVGAVQKYLGLAH